MITTNGIFLFNKQGLLLIVHAPKSRHDMWSIPKGINNDGEDHWTAAKRELSEETGIDLQKCEYDTKFAGECLYKKKKKKLIATTVTLKTDICDILHCSSMVTDKQGNILYPEIDKFKWVTIDEAVSLLHDTQKNLLYANNKQI